MSQPQNAKIEPVRPMAKAEIDIPVNGLNQSMSKDNPAGASSVATLTKAMVANTISTSIWNPTR